MVQSFFESLPGMMDALMPQRGDKLLIFMRVNNKVYSIMADRTGLEPATSGVTGRHSNQLNYRSERYCVVLNKQRPQLKIQWWVVQGSNL